jgi:putative transposase
MGSLSEDGRAAGAVHSLGYHLVWCPKYRRPVLGGRVADRLRELIAAKCVERGWSVEALEVMPEHVHLFTRCGPDASPARLAHQLKGATSRALRTAFPHLRLRLSTPWSKSWFVASVGRVVAATIRRYIAEQTTRPTMGAP